jgi:hypothetical protein
MGQPYVYPCIFSTWLKKIFHLFETLWICEHITILIFYDINCRLVYPFLNSFMPLYKSLMFLFLLLVSSSLILSLRYSLFLFLNVQLASRLKFFRLSPLIWLGFCNNCNLACFLWSINFEHPSSDNRLL